MTTKVEKTIEVDVPVSTAYNQWTQFESFPEFMGGITSVTQLGDQRLHWVAEIAGVKREWDARIVDQVPDSVVSWVATEGATNAGAVRFTPLGATRTLVQLELEYEPEGVVEAAGDKLGIVEKRTEADLEKFKKFIESRGGETGAWRGSVDDLGVAGTPGVEDAAGTEGDSGKAGVSGKAVAAGLVAAAAGAAVAGAVAKKSGDDEDDSIEVRPASAPAPVTTPEPVVTSTAESTPTPASGTTQEDQVTGTRTDDAIFGTDAEPTVDNPLDGEPPARP